MYGCPRASQAARCSTYPSWLALLLRPAGRGLGGTPEVLCLGCPGALEPSTKAILRATVQVAVIQVDGSGAIRPLASIVAAVIAIVPTRQPVHANPAHPVHVIASHRLHATGLPAQVHESPTPHP